MTAPAASIIIPTRNRATVLERTVRALFGQDCHERFEIIVVDDGSSDDTGEVLHRLQQESGDRLRWYAKQNGGPASARNLAMKHAKGGILVFLGDDTIPVPHFLREHLDWHRSCCREEESGVLGRIEWDPSLPVSHLMQFLNSGPQFRYNEIVDKIRVDASYFVSSNVSLKSSFLHGTSFDETFKNAAWEDVELGYRLSRQGMQLYYNSEALCFHHHPTHMKSFRRRNRLMGRDIRILYQIHPELRASILQPARLNLTERLAKWTLALLYPLALVFGAKRLLNPYFSLCLKYDLFRGYCGLER